MGHGGGRGRGGGGDSELTVHAFGQARRLGALRGEARTAVTALVQYLEKGCKAEQLSRRTQRRRATPGSGGAAGTAGAAAESGDARGGGKRTLDDVAADMPRVKRLKLGQGAVDRAEQAMANCPSCPFKSLAELEQGVRGWCDAYFASFDANEYYDEQRTKGYTAANAEIQQRLGLRTLDLTLDGLRAPQPPQQELGLGLALDVACGSGLSSKAVLAGGASFVVGCDVASAMLDEAVASAGAQPLDYVLADMRQRPPFRDGCFERCVSVSALHYLANSAEELATCLGGVRAVVGASGAPRRAAFQFFPAKPEEELPRVMYAARAVGWRSAAIVVDQTHHTASHRYYLLLRDGAAAEDAGRECRLYPPGLQCVLCCSSAARVPAEHLEWVRGEHCRVASSLLRSLRRDPALLPDPAQRALAGELAAALGLDMARQGEVIPSLPELRVIFDDKLAPVLHWQPPPPPEHRRAQQAPPALPPALAEAMTTIA